MTRSVNKRPGAVVDIVDCAAFLALQRRSVATRFLAAVEETIARLAEHPYSGRRCVLDSGRLEGLRYRGVIGFRKFLVFYLPTENGVDVLHVVHGARDLLGVLGQEG